MLHRRQVLSPSCVLTGQVVSTLFCCIADSKLSSGSAAPVLELLFMWVLFKNVEVINGNALVIRAGVLSIFPITIAPIPKFATSAVLVRFITVPMATVRYADDIASGTIWIDGITIFVCFTKGTVVRGSCAAILWIAAGQCFTSTGTIIINVGAGVPAHKPIIILVRTQVGVPAR